MNMGPSQTVTIQHVIYYTVYYSKELSAITTHLRFGYGELYINTTTSGVFFRGRVLLWKVWHVLIYKLLTITTTPSLPAPIDIGTNSTN